MRLDTTLNEVAATIVAIDDKDLPELARIHGCFEVIGQSEEAPPSVKKLTANAMRYVEQIILQETTDPIALLEKISETVVTIQTICEQGELATAASCEPEPDAPVVQSANECRTETAASPGLGTVNEGLEADPELLGEFIMESLEHLERAEASLLNLESNPDDLESVNAIFRAFHTIKGTSGFLGLRTINAVAHKAEFLLDRARQGKVRLVGGYADLALSSADMLRKLIHHVREADTGAPEPEGVEQLLEHLDSPEQAVDESRPAEPSTLRLGDVLVAQGVADRKAIEAAASIPSDEKIGAKLIKTGVASAREVVSAMRTQKQMTAAPAVGDATLRVSMERLDKLIDMVGELVIAQAMVGQDRQVRECREPAFTRKVTHLGKITRELQDLTLSMRMVPLKGTFQKMARLVRDVARKSGKEVHFLTEGEDTEIDRNMVDAIGDPLVHMMRNAVDHGIESPEERSQKGKPAQGTVLLRAYHAGGKVVIEVQDDGKGLDPARILAKARERGLVESDRELSQQEIYELLFLPGFSTAEKVTDVSGRGVGMDVVKRNIESLRGRVDVTSKVGQGSVFTIRLPLTLAIIDGMILQVGSEHYIMPTLNIEQAFRPEPSYLSTVTERGEMVMLRGKLIPIFRLHRLFGVRNAIQEATDGLLVVVEHEGERCALLADSLLGQQQVVIKSLGAALGDVHGVSGAAILGDGRVGLILDVASVIRVALGDAQQEAA